MRGDATYVKPSGHADSRPQTLRPPDGDRWRGLAVLDSHEDGDTARVFFRATCRGDDDFAVLEQRSRFVREQGRWFYPNGWRPQGHHRFALRAGRGMAIMACSLSWPSRTTASNPAATISNSLSVTVTSTITSANLANSGPDSNDSAIEVTASAMRPRIWLTVHSGAKLLLA